MASQRSVLLSIVSLLGLTAAGHAADNPDKKPLLPANVSYYKDIRPILAQNCQGCHQPAKPLGDYVMTSHPALLKKGERGDAGVIPGKPQESEIIRQVTSQDGKKPAMPKGKDPLTDHQVSLIKQWISQGAKDDSPASARIEVDQAHPPVYTLPPVITSVDYSPDGELLAVAGYHEVLLHRADGSGLVARLVGLSERVQSLAFSPTGDRLAVSGGSPGRFGEVQVWQLNRKVIDRSPFADAVRRSAGAAISPAAAAATALAGAAPPITGLLVKHTADIESAKLRFSVPVTFDTVYGVSWSPDGTKIAFGCGDNTLRAIDAADGNQILFQGAHNDWVLDTVFSGDSVHLVSVSRDRSMKLIEVATQRFIDNVTSITPGVLKGGLLTVARRPQKEKVMVKPSPDYLSQNPLLYDELLAAGSDGVPRLYKMHRSTKRVIGDDANKLREFEAMPGRIYSVKFSADGSRFVAGSSLEGKGEARVYQVADGKIVSRLEGIQSPIYAVAYHPEGKHVAVAGFDGSVRLHDPETGKLLHQFVPVPLTGKGVATGK